MRIAFDYQCFQDQSQGGITRYIVELVNGLRKTEDVQIGGWAGLHQSDSLVPLPGLRIGKGWIVGKHTGRLIRGINRFSFETWSTMSFYDIYHATYYRSLKRPRRSARVITVYDCIHELGLAGNDCDLELKRRSILGADHIICISKRTKDDLMKFYDVPSEKVSVVHLGCSLGCRPIEQLADTIPRPYVLYVGRRGDYKNFSILIESFADRTLRGNLAIVCVGGGPLGRDEVTADTGDNLKHETMPTDRRLADLYTGAVALVYPSRYEGFGLPLIEAMRCGCPVITTRCGSIPEIAGDAAWYFDPDDSSKLAELIKQAYTDRAARAALIASGYQRAEIFSWERCIGATMEAYRKTIAA